VSAVKWSQSKAAGMRPSISEGDEPVSSMSRMKRFGPAGWALSSRLLSLGASTLVAMVLARALGPDEFGRFAVATSVAIGGSLAVSGGLNRSLLRDVASLLAHGRRRDARNLLWTGARALAVSGPLGVLATGLVARLILQDDSTILVLTALLAVVLGILLIASDVLRALGEYRLANLTSGHSGGAFVAIGFSFIALWSVTRPQTAIGALAVNITAAVVGTAVALVFVARTAKRETDGPRQPNGPNGPRAVALAGVPFAIAQVATFLMVQVDLWIASVVLNDSDTGLYAVAVRFMNVVRVPLSAAQLTLAAAIPMLYSLGRRELLELRLRRAATAASLTASFVLLPCMIAAGPVLSVVFGDDYRDAAPILIALALGQVVNVATGLSGLTLSLCGYERLILAVALVSVFVATTLDFVAATLWGVNGLAVASASVSATSYIVVWKLARSRLRIWTHPLWPSARNLRYVSTDG
jgi:O-antigen/teichoic acid export membrane protein